MTEQVDRDVEWRRFNLTKAVIEDLDNFGSKTHGLAMDIRSAATTARVHGPIIGSAVADIYRLAEELKQLGLDLERASEKAAKG